MRTLSANLTTENNKDANLPVIEVQINGVTNRYSSGTFSSISANHKKLIKDFIYTMPPVDLLDGLQSNPQFRVDITDKDRDLTGDINANSFFDRQVTARFGDQNIVIGDFFDFPSFNIKGKLELSEKFQSWILTGVSAFKFLKQDIFRDIPKTTLSGDFLKGAGGPISVASFTSFVDVTNMPSKIGGISFLKIDSEIVKYLTMTGGEADTITRGVFGTDDTDHFDGAEVLQFFAFPELYPTDFLLFLLLTTTDGSGHAYYDLTSFDTAFAGFGLGLSSTEVNITSIERLGYQWFFQEEACHFLGSFRTEQSKSWIKRELLEIANLILYVDSGNQLNVGIVDYHQMLEFDATGNTLTQADIKITNYNIILDRLINEIRYEYAIDPISGKNGRSIELEYDSSTATHGAADKRHVVKSRLLDDMDPAIATNPPRIVWNTARRLFFMFGNPVAEIEFESQPPNWLFEPIADSVTVSNTKIPDIENDGEGISNQYVITGQTIKPISDPRSFKYNALSPEPYNIAVAIARTFTVVTEGSITDTSIVFRSGADLLQNASDGNHTFAGDVTAPLLYYDIKVTPPNTGTTEHWISLRFKLFTSFPLFTGAVVDKVKILRYNSGDSAAFTARIMAINNDTTFLGLSIFRSAYVQWFFANASAGSGERPSSVELVEFGFVNILATFSEV